VLWPHKKLHSQRDLPEVSRNCFQSVAKFITAIQKVDFQAGQQEEKGRDCQDEQKECVP
jgi:hypothetical protein